MANKGWRRPRDIYNPQREIRLSLKLKGFHDPRFFYLDLFFIVAFIVFVRPDFPKVSPLL
jgi:hypothetical protein